MLLFQNTLCTALTITACIDCTVEASDLNAVGSSEISDVLVYKNHGDQAILLSEVTAKANVAKAPFILMMKQH